MKKLTYILTALFIALFASCAQEEAMEVMNTDGRVNLSLELPSMIGATRAEIQVPANYKMRCILEVWTNRDDSELKYRKEQIVDNGVPTFDFTLKSGDYTCLFWTDFVTADATAETVTTADGVTYEHYTDLFYNTTDLKSVTINVDNGADFFDTDACDAFFARMDLEKSIEGVNKTVRLNRPLAKLVVKENDGEQFSSLTRMSVNYEVPAGFNVLAGTPLTSTRVVSLSKTEFNKENNPERVLFTSYLFAPVETEMKMGVISFQFALGSTLVNREIPEESIALLSNRLMNVKGALIGDGTFVPEPTELPKVGDFYYQNGTYSSEYIASASNPCLGVVFAVANNGGEASYDAVENYPGKNLKKINGWVIAAYDCKAVSGSNLAGIANDDVEVPVSVKKTKDDILGYQNTKAFEAMGENENYPVLCAIQAYSEAYPAPLKSSGWYWGAAGQYAALMKVYAEAKNGELINSLAVRNSLQVLKDAGVGELFGKKDRRYWYSTCSSEKQKLGFACILVTNKDFGSLEDDWEKASRSHNARAILTF